MNCDGDGPQRTPKPQVTKPKPKPTTEGVSSMMPPIPEVTTPEPTTLPKTTPKPTTPKPLGELND